MKYLAIVERTADGFRGYAHRLPGCEVRAATEQEAEAAIIAAVKQYVADGKAGAGNGDVEVVVAVEGTPPERPRGDGMDEVYDQLRKDTKPEELEWVLDFSWEKVLAEGEAVDVEEVLRELEAEEGHLSGGAAGE